MLELGTQRMARLTITLPEEKHRALKEAAARSGKTIGKIVAESLEFYGIKTQEQARELVARARQRARLDKKQAIEIAVKETRAERKR
jgi:hypothetical protein